MRPRCISRIVIQSKHGEDATNTDVTLLTEDGEALKFGFGPNRVVVDYNVFDKNALGPSLTLTFLGPAFEVVHMPACKPAVPIDEIPIAGGGE